MTFYSSLSRKRRSVVFGVLACAATLFGCSPKPVQFHSMDVTGAQWGQNFALPDLHGKTTSIGDFQGKVVVVFFGFLYCPDACPTHLAKMTAVKEKLGPKAKDVAVVFITVDPERDQPESLEKFLQAFDPSFIGLRGDIDQTQAVGKDFRVYFKKVATSSSAKDPMAYTIDHTTFSYLYDPQGRLRLVAPHDITVEKLARDIETLLGR